MKEKNGIYKKVMIFVTMLVVAWVVYRSIWPPYYSTEELWISRVVATLFPIIIMASVATYFYVKSKGKKGNKSNTSLVLAGIIFLAYFLQVYLTFAIHGLG